MVATSIVAAATVDAPGSNSDGEGGGTATGLAANLGFAGAVLIWAGGTRGPGTLVTYDQVTGKRNVAP